MAAPVLPAEITASTSPERQSLLAITTEESFFVLIARAGDSSIPMTSPACTIFSRPVTEVSGAGCFREDMPLSTTPTAALMES